jgi:hypothetical protein
MSPWTHCHPGGSTTESYYRRAILELVLARDNRCVISPRIHDLIYRDFQETLQDAYKWNQVKKDETKKRYGSSFNLYSMMEMGCEKLGSGGFMRFSLPDGEDKEFDSRMEEIRLDFNWRHDRWSTKLYSWITG